MAEEPCLCKSFGFQFILSQYSLTSCPGYNNSFYEVTISIYLILGTYYLLYIILQNKYVISDGILHISKVEMSDFREYTCVATNKIGFAKHSIFLQKHYDPGKRDDYI